MRLTRVHVDAPLSAGLRLALPESAAAHLLRVLRLREGDACVLFNGDGHDYDARIVAADRRGGEVVVEGARPVDNESPLSVILVQGIARGEKMDWILQKATELGVTGIVPVHSERGEVRLDGARAEKRLAHWRSVVVSACEQSGRARVPQVAAAAALADIATRLPADTTVRLTLDPLASSGPGRFPQGIRHPALAIAIGPEGGWSLRDLAVLQGQGFTGLRLGPRVMRTETAGIAAIAALQAWLGDFRS